MRPFAFFNILGVVLFLASSGFGQQGIESKVDTCVQEELRVQRIPGLSIAVMKGEQVVLAKGFGMANVEHRVPATADTVYQIGSMGKQFTATAVNSFGPHIPCSPNHARAGD